MKGFIELTLHPVHGGGRWILRPYTVTDIVSRPDVPTQIFVEGGGTSQLVMETAEKIAELIAIAEAEDK